MGNAAVIRCSWQENGQAAVILSRISEPNITDDQGGASEVLRGLAPRAFGFSDDIEPSKRITFNYTVQEGAQEVDWKDAARRKAEGVFTKTVGASSTNYPCKVDSVEEAGDERRHETWTVNLLALFAEPA
jgi:hypothetical protein